MDGGREGGREGSLKLALLLIGTHFVFTFLGDCTEGGGGEGEGRREGG